MNSQTASDSSTDEIPFILRGSYFELVTIDKKTGKTSANCLECKRNGKSKQVHGFVHPTSNFVTHLKTCHAHLHEAYRNDMKEPGKKLKAIKTSTLPTNQPTLPFQRVVIPSKVVLAETLIVNYIVDSIIPLSTVDNPAFKDLVPGLCNGARVPDRKRLKALIVEKYNRKANRLIKNLNEAKYYCITADIWSSHPRSFFGATIHWINEDMERKSSVLTMTRFTGTHDFEKVTEMLLSIFERFKITRDKLTCIVTDNASNFVKAFKEHGVQLIREIDEKTEDEIEIDVLDVPSLPTLPIHQRCTSHTLSLVATMDLDNANIVTPLGPDNFKKAFRAALSKCNGIWNCILRSVKVSEDVSKLCGKTLIRPGPTRWNSVFDAIRRLLEVREHLTEICKLSVVQTFMSNDLDLLDEYVEAMKSIACALDKLQGEKTFFFGYLAPVILRTKKELEKICEEKRRFGSAIARALLADSISGSLV